MVSERPVIFLDIDGVLVTHESLKGGGMYCACSRSVGLLNKFIADVDAEVVISSSWRIGHSVDFIRGALAARGLFRHEAVIDKTEHIHWKSESGIITGTATRADEIREWLSRNPRESFVIFDDAWDAEIEGHYVRTNMEEGLTYEHLNRALDILTARAALRKVGE